MQTCYVTSQMVNYYVPTILVSHRVSTAVARTHVIFIVNALSNVTRHQYIQLLRLANYLEMQKFTVSCSNLAWALLPHLIRDTIE